MKKIFALIAFCLFYITCAVGLFFTRDHAQYIKQFIEHYNANSHFHSISKIKQENLKLQITEKKLYITLDKLQISDDIDFTQVKFRVKLGALLLFKTGIDLIEIASCNIKNQENIYFNNHILLAGSLFSYIQKIPDIKIYNAKISDKDNKDIFTLSKIYARNGSDDNNTIEVEFSRDLSYTNNNQGSSTKITISKVNEKINELSIIAKVRGNDIHIREKYENGSFSSGELKIVASNIIDLLSCNFKSTPYTLSNFTQTKSFVIQSNIKNDENFIYLDNINIKSDFITANGNAIIPQKKDYDGSLKIKFDQIDIGKLFTRLIPENEQNLEIKKYTNYLIQDIFQYTKFQTEILIDNILIEGVPIINQFNLSTTTDNSKLHIDNFSLAFENNGSLKLTGAITKNPIRDLFVGNLYFMHKNMDSVINLFKEKAEITNKEKGSFKINAATQTQDKTENKQYAIPIELSSKLEFSSVDFNFHSLQIKFNNFITSGNMTIKYLGGIPRINLELELDEMDMDKYEYPIFKELLNYASSLTSDMKHEDYLKKFDLLRIIPFIINSDFKFKNLKIFNRHIEQLRLISLIKPLVVDISSFEIDAQNIATKLHGNANLNLRNMTPELSVNIKSGNLFINFLSPQNLIELKNKTSNEIDLSKIKINFTSNFDSLIQDNLVFKNLKTEINTQSNLINIGSINCGFLNGNMTIAGNIILEPYNINIVYALNNGAMSEIAQITPNNLVNPNGLFSINGMITTHGDNSKQLLYNLYTKSSFLVKDSVINKFSIDEFIYNANTQEYDIQNADNDFVKILNSGQTSVKEARCDIDLDKGIASFNNCKLYTEYSAANFVAKASIYSFALNSSSLFGFYIKNNEDNKFSNTNYKNKKNSALQVKINSSGTLFEYENKTSNMPISTAIEDLRNNQ